MEPAKPIALKTPSLNENELKMVDIKTFTFIIDNINYTLDFGKSENKENIIFKVNNNLSNKYYYLKMNLKEFADLNYIFNLHQNIDEIYDLLLNLLNDNKYSITFNNNLIILVIQFPIPGGKILNITFNFLEYIIRPE